MRVMENEIEKFRQGERTSMQIWSNGEEVEARE